MGQGHPQYQYRLGDEGIESSPDKKDLGDTGGWKAGRELAVCALSPERQPYAGLHEKKCDQQVKRDDFALLLWSGETSPRILHPVLEPSAQDQHRPVEAGPEVGHKNEQRVGTPLLWGKAERVRAVQTGEEKALSRPYCGLSVLKWGLWEIRGQTFQQGLMW